LKAGQEFLKQIINTYNACRGIQTRVGMIIGRNRNGKKSQYNVGLEEWRRIKYERWKQCSEGFSLPVPLS
jgi:hypothetical protein